MKVKFTRKTDKDMKLKHNSPEIKSLKKSPLFNLSLTNKELFHSNFLAWFGKLYPELFIQLISDLLGDKNWADRLDVKKIEMEHTSFRLQGQQIFSIQHQEPSIIEQHTR
jgi:hypothetical protein